MPRPLETQLSHFNPGRTGKERNMVYLIQVGNYSRRGTFNKLHEKAILVEDGSTFYEVEKYFKNKYEGFVVNIVSVKAEPIKEIEHLVNEDKSEELKVPERISAIKNFKIKYTDEERKLRDKWENFGREAKDALRQLHLLIERRYSELYYSDFNYGDYKFELETNTFGTKCINFPVKASLFMEAAKECNGEIPEKSTPPEFPESNSADKTEIDKPLFDNNDLESENGSSPYASDDIPF
jgi:hypothetical protein